MELKNITIIGVGLIGGSFGLSLRKSGFSGRISGVGRNSANLERARALGAIDSVSRSLTESVVDADLVFLATPVGEFPEIVRTMRECLKKGAIVTDAGSVKDEVIRELEPLMPEGAHFIGGHPIAGKECSGVDAASSELFSGAPCIITPSENTDKNALETVVTTWQSLGARTHIMDPQLHDAIFAAVSHMPHVISYALVNSILDIDKSFIRHGGSGLRDMTRIALSSPELWRDICAYNSEHILASLRKFQSALSRTEKLISDSDWEGLLKEFHSAKAGRQLLETD